MRVALDTNKYTDLCRGESALKHLLEHAETIALPLPVVAELRAGFAMAIRGAENEAVLQRFLLKRGVYMLLPDEQTTRVYAELYRQLRMQGTPIPTNDLWIASLCVQHELSLVSRDEHFGRLPQLRRAGA